MDLLRNVEVFAKFIRRATRALYVDHIARINQRILNWQAVIPEFCKDSVDIRILYAYPSAIELCKRNLLYSDRNLQEVPTTPVSCHEVCSLLRKYGPKVGQSSWMWEKWRTERTNCQKWQNRASRRSDEGIQVVLPIQTCRLRAFLRNANARDWWGFQKTFV